MSILLKNVHFAVGGKSNLGIAICGVIPKALFSTSNCLSFADHWLSYNDKVFPPQDVNEERRPAFVCHVKEHIKYSPDKMWYVANFIKGMSVDEAIRQLKLVPKKGAKIAIDTILEAQKKAVEEHNVEYKTDLWVAESFATRGKVLRGLRRHAKMRIGEVRYKYCHYHVRLEEGTPPPIYYYKDRFRSGPELLDAWLRDMRSRNVKYSI